MSAVKLKRQDPEQLVLCPLRVGNSQPQKAVRSKILERTTISIDVAAVIRAIGYAVALVIAAINGSHAALEAIQSEPIVNAASKVN